VVAGQNGHLEERKREVMMSLSKLCNGETRKEDEVNA
jgi:hypothetical protein